MQYLSFVDFIFNEISINLKKMYVTKNEGYKDIFVTIHQIWFDPIGWISLSSRLMDLASNNEIGLINDSNLDSESILTFFVAFLINSIT